MKDRKVAALWLDIWLFLSAVVSCFVFETNRNLEEFVAGVLELS